MCSYNQFIWIRHTELCVCSLGKYCSIFNSDFFSFCEKKTWIENIYIYFLPVPASVCSQSLEGLFFQALPPWLPKSLSAGCPHCLSVHLPQKSTRECVKLHLEACKGDNKREKSPSRNHQNDLTLPSQRLMMGVLRKSSKLSRHRTRECVLF